MIDPTGEQVWNQFLAAWPRARLLNMALPEYTASGNQETLTYWLEGRTEKLGSIWGGSAFKFGIFSRRSEKPKTDGGGLSYNDSYAWYSKYGDTAEAAFKKIRELIVGIADAANRLDLESIEAVEFSPAIKWKLAFLYQLREAPLIVPVYKKINLKAYLETAALPRDGGQAAIYRRIRESLPDKDILELGSECWQASEKQIAGQGFSISAAEGFLKERYGYRRPPTQKIAAFETEPGRELALPREGHKVRLLLQPPLPALQGLGDAEIYPPDRGRHSNLASQAPTLAAGQPAVQVTIPDLRTLEKLCDLYESGATPEGVSLAEATTAAASSVPRPPLNVILFGPPGTGKTHATVAKALEAIDPAFLAANRASRETLTQRFRELQDLGRIRFITFHQSFSYEDFVEGIRATKDDDGQLVYKVEDGVFKNLCNAAAAKVTKSTAAPLQVADRTVWKMSLGNTRGEDAYVFDECIDKGYALLGYGSSIDYSGCRTREDIRKKQVAAGKQVGDQEYSTTSVHTFVCVMKPGDLIVVTDGNFKFRAIGEVRGNYRHLDRGGRDNYAQCRDVTWHRVYSPSLPAEQLMNNQFSQMTLYELRPGSIDPSKLAALFTAQYSDRQAAPTDSAGWVLIIDEINRGNISRIFGELITLIEPSRRAGATEALSVQLPYSREILSVPNNLYLIGTMNTADRSLAGLDIALRRRFVFEEMPPDPTQLEGIEVDGLPIDDLLTILNDRIEALRDADHCLGHSYFLPLRNDPSVKQLSGIFRSQVLPLLQEYFFEDWERIRWVLNDHAKTSIDFQFVTTPARNLACLFGQDIAPQLEERRWVINERAFERIESYKGILGT